MEQQMRFCTSADGTRIAYASMGQGPPLALVGAWASTECQQNYPYEQGYLQGVCERRLFVRYDRRGSGGSQREVGDFSLEAQVSDLAAVVEQLEPERFDLFAIQDGTPIAVAYAAQHPERVSGLVLWCAFPHGDQIGSTEALEGLVGLVLGNWSLGRRAIAEVVYPTGPMELLRWFSSALRQSMSRQVAVEYLRFLFTADVRRYLPEIKAPTLVLHRRGCRNVPIDAGRAVAAMIPDARFVALEGDVADWYYKHEQYLYLMMKFLDEGREEVPRAYPAGLTGREVEVLRLIAAGKSNRKIAAELVISTNTVDRHVSNIFAKTGAANRAEAASYAVRRELA